MGYNNVNVIKTIMFLKVKLMVFYELFYVRYKN